MLGVALVAAWSLVAAVAATDRCPGPAAAHPPARTLAELTLDAQHVFEGRIHRAIGLPRGDARVLEIRAQRGFLGESGGSSWLVLAPRDVELAVGDAALWFLVAAELAPELDLGPIPAHADLWSVAGDGAGCWTIDAHRADLIGAPHEEVALPESLDRGVARWDRLWLPRASVVEWLRREIELDVVAIHAAASGVRGPWIRLDVNGGGQRSDAGSGRTRRVELGERAWRELRERIRDARLASFPQDVGRCPAPCTVSKLLEVHTRAGVHSVRLWPERPREGDPMPWKRASELWDALPWKE